MNVSHRLVTLTLVAAIGLTAAPSSAGWFIKIGNIEGDVVDDNKDHKKWVNLLEVNLSTTPTDLDSVDPFDVSFSKEVDSSSPALEQAAASGQVFGNIDIDFADVHPASGEKVTYYQWELKDVIVSSYGLSTGSDGTVIETVTLGPPAAGNLVEDEFDAAGKKRDRRVRSYRTDPVTGLPDYNFENPTVSLPGGVALQPKGTPHVEVGDFNGDGLDDMALSSLSSSAVDGYNGNILAHEMGHNWDMRHKDPNNLARVEGDASFDNGERYTFGVEREMKESGEKSARLSADFDGIGSSAYDYVVTNGGVVVAEGTVSGLDDAILLSGTGDPTGLLDESAAVSLAYGEIEWSFTAMDKAGHGGAIFVLDPTLTTTVTLEAVDPFSSSALLTDFGFGFGNFESVVVTGVTAVPEPGAAVLVAIGLAAIVRRR